MLCFATTVAFAAGIQVLSRAEWYSDGRGPEDPVSRHAKTSGQIAENVTLLHVPWFTKYSARNVLVEFSDSV